MKSTDDFNRSNESRYSSISPPNPKTEVGPVGPTRIQTLLVHPLYLNGGTDATGISRVWACFNGALKSSDSIAV